MRLQLTLLIICFFYVIGMTAEAPKQKLLWSDDFKELSSKTVFPSARPLLEKKGKDLATLEQLQFPKKWSVDWGVFTDKYDIKISEQHGVILNAFPQLVLYGPIFDAGQQFFLELDCSGAGTINWGIFGYGLEQGARQEKYEINSTEKMTVRFELKNNSFDKIRPMLSISGKIQIEQVRIFVEPISDISTVEGTITAISSVPSPINSDYPDCYYTAEFMIEHILEGVPTPHRIILLLPAFYNYQPSAYVKLQNADKLRLRIRSFEKLSDEQKLIQQADDLQQFYLENFLLLSATPIQEYTTSEEQIPFSDIPDNYISIFDAHLNPPVSLQSVEIKKEFMKRDLEYLSSQIASFEAQKDLINKDFLEAWKLEQDRDIEGHNRLDPNLVWRNLDGSFWALPMNYELISQTSEIQPDNLIALVELNRALESNGIQLIIQAIPGYYSISARVMNPKFRETLDYQTAIVVRQLLNAGIEAQYVSRDLINNYDRHPFMFFYPTNPHPADTCQDVLTDCILTRLKRFIDIQTPHVAASEFSELQASTVYGSEYTWPKNCDIGNNTPEKEILCTHILRGSKPIIFDQNSPILVIGNSFIQTPMPANSYSSYLAKKLCLLPDNFQVSGYGPMLTIINSLFNNRERYLVGKKVVILPLGVYFLTAHNPFTNIAELDRMKQLLNGRTLRDVVPVDIKYSSSNQSNTADPLFLKWRDFIGQKTTEFVFPLGQDCRILSTNLSDRIDSTLEMVCYIKIATFQLQSVQLSVNGTSKIVPQYMEIPQWQDMTFLLPAGTTQLDISMKTFQPETLVAIKSIMIYQ